jgi:hypothetical protein
MTIQNRSAIRMGIGRSDCYPLRQRRVIVYRILKDSSRASVARNKARGNAW